MQWAITKNGSPSKIIIILRKYYDDLDTRSIKILDEKTLSVVVIFKQLEESFIEKFEFKIPQEMKGALHYEQRISLPYPVRKKPQICKLRNGIFYIVLKVKNEVEEDDEINCEILE